MVVLNREQDRALLLQSLEAVPVVKTQQHHQQEVYGGGQKGSSSSHAENAGPVQGQGEETACSLDPTDLLFLRGLMDSPIMKALIKGKITSRDMGSALRANDTGMAWLRRSAASAQVRCGGRHQVEALGPLLFLLPQLLCSVSPQHHLSMSPFINMSMLKFSSDRELLLALLMSLPRENKRSTAALDGIAVLYIN
ncbi:hypothetical protein GWK47_026510 [Chionoecetes opilio]|uniref:Uncharacterized protein n=1 Tax=Chionoecetes opilio TaxID=41210 RepID=A0A8J8WNI0_CHIOP|nr:hypothetical protein GWK47_026510 [Chionoecetes opilio]